MQIFIKKEGHKDPLRIIEFFTYNWNPANVF